MEENKEKTNVEKAVEFSKEEKYRRGFDEWLRKVFLMVSYKK